MFRAIINNIVWFLKRFKNQRDYIHNILATNSPAYRQQFIAAAARYGYAADAVILSFMLDRYIPKMPEKYYARPLLSIAMMDHLQLYSYGHVPALSSKAIDRLFNPVGNIVLTSVDGVPFINLYEYPRDFGAGFYKEVMRANGIDLSQVVAVKVEWAETVLYDKSGLAVVTFFGAGQYKASRPWRQPNTHFVLELLDVQPDVVQSGALRFEISRETGHFEPVFDSIRS
jgi:hypothetical protein